MRDFQCAKMNERKSDCHSHVICTGNPIPAILNSLAPVLVTPNFVSAIAYFTVKYAMAEKKIWAKYTLFQTHVDRSSWRVHILLSREGRKLTDTALAVSARLLIRKYDVRTQISHSNMRLLGVFVVLFKEPGQLWNRAYLDTSFATLKSVYLNPESNTRQIHLEVRFDHDKCFIRSSIFYRKTVPVYSFTHPLITILSYLAIKFLWYENQLRNCS